MKSTFRRFAFGATGPTGSSCCSSGGASGMLESFNAAAMVADTDLLLVPVVVLDFLWVCALQTGAFGAVPSSVDIYRWRIFSCLL